MARQSNFTPEEDAIILATANMPADVTNTQLMEAGHSEHTPEALKRRRIYLRNQEAHQHMPEQRQKEHDMLRLMALRRSLEDELMKLKAREKDLQERLALVNTDLVPLLNELAAYTKEVVESANDGASIS